ncbi:MAG: 16S rRNA (cytosine(1402)-N(4))-methyltransferase RsmH [Desulfobacterales bacterium]|nr:16S rRNA (cytosine(1402)-N(4))-methyltransferase RsmH [Desulfobacterales bacterium]
MPYRHISVMPKEVIQYLDCKPGNIIVDCTLGGAGHSRDILERILPDGILIGIDQDGAAIKNAEKVLEPYKDNVRLFNNNFVDLPEILSSLNLNNVNGILIDLGVSLYQLKYSGRGFSFNLDEPLDMRMDSNSDTTAEDLVNSLSNAELTSIFKKYGEERKAKQIANKITRARQEQAITTSKQLADLVCSAIPRKLQKSAKIHPATRVFMALRIAVNRELERLETFMETAVDYLYPGGRMCVLAFHSLEDRIVKQKFKALERSCICPPGFPVCTCSEKKEVQILTRKVVKPGPDEIEINPMARSTRLRAIEKI